MTPERNEQQQVNVQPVKATPEELRQQERIYTDRDNANRQRETFTQRVVQKNAEKSNSRGF